MTAIIEREPEHPEPVIEFDYTADEAELLTLRSFLRPYRPQLVLAVALVIVETLALQAGPLLTKIGIDRGVIAGDRSVLVVVALVFVATIVVHAGASWWRISFTGRLGETLMERLRVRVFSHMERQSLDFYTDEKAGVLMTRMTSDIEALTMLFQEGLVNMAVQGLTLVVIATVLLILDPLLAVIALFVVVPATMALAIWFKRASEIGYLRVRDRIADLLSDLQESLAGIRVISAFNRRDVNVARHRQIVDDYRDANVETARAAAIFGPAAEGVGIVGQAVVLLIGGRMVLDGRLSIGDLTAFALYLTAFFAPIAALVQLYNSYQQGQAAMSKLRDLLATRPSVIDRLDAGDLPPVDGAIELTGVHFGYDPENPVLRGVDLSIDAGETIAIVGPTGAGKSTVAKLVSRFYDPDAGTVSIDGHPLTTVTQMSLRRQLGVVPQEPFLFNGTVADNLRVARPDAEDAELVEAAEAVGMADLLAGLPHGIDSPVHERGTSLSSGERQLLALARAFLARPRVLVLDEATSNLDLKSESQIERALDTLLDGRTAILIAHRLATAKRADRIVVIEDGGVQEVGSHDELVAAGGRYAEMYQTWERGT
ncbi:MAG: ABC transporter ATP-binding protein/permease [Acidimicrobiia bacterium]|nr:ABC transporter ATP-binding protein/permease [Acidimicrobiia bacterium]